MNKIQYSFIQRNEMMHKIIFMHYRQHLGFESAGPSENYYAYRYFTLSDANLAETIGVTM